MEFAWSDSDKAYRARLHDVLATLPEHWWQVWAAQGPSSPDTMKRAREFNALPAAENPVVQHWPREYGGEDLGRNQHFPMDVVMAGQIHDFYSDVRAELGHYLEYFHMLDGARAMFAQVEDTTIR